MLVLKRDSELTRQPAAERHGSFHPQALSVMIPVCQPYERMIIVLREKPLSGDARID
jgi:hypothetical protein